ncbi:MAG: hypothetical protein K2F59_03595, partial [Eubacteriales bacterium]|nr:hypothetical protein [Eubacteriales bacterium]
MIDYKVNLKDKNIIIELKTEKEKCIYCGGDVIFNSICKTNLSNKKIFYKEFNEEIKIKLLYKRMRCKNCARTFSKYSCSD